MTTTVYPDREQRPGGRFSTAPLVRELLQFAAVERAVAHVVAGWVPKIGELDAKLRIGGWHEDAMVRAAALRHHALGLLERDEAALLARAAWVEPLRALDASAQAADVVRGLSETRALLLDRYREFAARLDVLYDARHLATVRAAITALAEPSALTLAPDAAIVAGVRGVGAALATALADVSSPEVHLDELMWSPVDRVPVPARPAGRPRGVAGRRSHFRTTSRLESADIAGELNNNVTSELCAMELMCRCSYEHPELPWAFHLSMARHATDEARHAAIFRRLMARNGFDESTLPQHGSNYELSYQFPECETGSQHELVWRLLIMCTVLEGLAIDKMPVEIAIRDWLGQADFARALDYIAADELFHAENGLRWSREVCGRLGLSSLLDRERAHGRFFGRQEEVRRQYLEADPERAAFEIAIMQHDPDDHPFESRLQVELRKRATFTDDDCDQVDRWGYNPPVAAPA